MHRSKGQCSWFGFAAVSGVVLASAVLGGGCDATPKAEAATIPAAASKQAAEPSPATGTPVGCGTSGLPDCPMQRWMKGTLQTYQRAGDHERLAKALRE